MGSEIYNLDGTSQKERFDPGRRLCQEKFQSLADLIATLALRTFDGRNADRVRQIQTPSIKI